MHSPWPAGGSLSRERIGEFCDEANRSTSTASFGQELGTVLSSFESLSSLSPAGRNRAAVDRDPAPAVDRLVALRFAKLEPNAIETVRAAAVLGTAAPFDDVIALRRLALSRSIETSTDDAKLRTRTAADVDALRGVGLLRMEAHEPASAGTTAVAKRNGGRAPSLGESAGTGVVLHFAHDLLRDGVLRECSAAERDSLHSDAATIIAERGGAAGAIAWHLGAAEASDVPASSDRRRWLVHAAGEAAVTSPGLAARLLEEAVQGVDVGDVDMRSSFVSLVGHLASSGRLADSERLVRGLLAVPLVPGDELVLRWWLSSILFASGRMVEGLAVAEDGLGGARDPVTLARMSALIALIKVLQLDPGFVEALARAEVEAEKAGDPSATTIVRCLQSRRHGNALSITASHEDAVRAVESADSDVHGLAHRYQPLFFLCMTLLDRADRAGLARHIALGRRRAMQTGTSWADTLYLSLSAQMALREGRFDDALADARAAIAVSEDSGVKIGIVSAHATCAIVFSLRGDRASAETSLAFGSLGLAHDPLQLGADALAATATQRLLLGDVVVGLEAAMGAAEFFAAIGFFTSALEAVQPVLAFLNRCDDRGPWIARLFALFSADQADLADADGVLVAFRAQLRAFRVGTAAAWTDAVAAVDAEGWPLRAAFVRLCAAGVAARLGDDRLAQTWAADAHARLESFTAFEPASRAAVLTGRNKPRRTLAAPLSPTERRIASLISDGLSNREIAEETGQSVRTVEAHVSSVLRKLDVASRAKVAALLRP